MVNNYKSCKLCPRKCGVNRLAGETGFCGETAVLRIGAAVIHRGEEPPLVGTGGSGTIFVSGCNLGCVFCQNYQISHDSRRLQRRLTEKFPVQVKYAGNAAAGKSIGKPVSANVFAEICTALHDKGAENINIVTGSHAVPELVQGIITAKNAGMRLPVLWNSSAYESTETLEMLKDYIDIYLPDLKTLDSEIANKFFSAPGYPQTAASAILKMTEMTHGDANKKTIVRHLILPGYLESTRLVLRWFAENVKDRAQLSLMTQYTPIPGIGETAPNRYLRKDEYETVLEWLEEYGIEDGFCQELVTGSDWLPDFSRVNPFPSKLSAPVWSAMT